MQPLLQLWWTNLLPEKKLCSLQVAHAHVTHMLSESFTSKHIQKGAEVSRHRGEQWEHDNSWSNSFFQWDNSIYKKE